MAGRNFERWGGGVVERWGQREFSTDSLVLSVEPLDGAWGVMALDGHGGDFLQRAAVGLGSRQVAARKAEELALRIRSMSGGKLQVEVRQGSGIRRDRNREQAR